MIWKNEPNRPNWTNQTNRPKPNQQTNTEPTESAVFFSVSILTYRLVGIEQNHYQIGMFLARYKFGFYENRHCWFDLVRYRWSALDGSIGYLPQWNTWSGKEKSLTVAYKTKWKVWTILREIIRIIYWTSKTRKILVQPSGSPAMDNTVSKGDTYTGDLAGDKEVSKTAVQQFQLFMRNRLTISSTEAHIFLHWRLHHLHSSLYPGLQDLGNWQQAFFKESSLYTTFLIERVVNLRK